MNIDDLASRLIQTDLKGICILNTEFSIGICLSYGVMWCGKQILSVAINKLTYEAYPFSHSMIKTTAIFLMTIALVVGIGSSFAIGGITGLTFSSLASNFGPFGISIGLISGVSIGLALAVKIGIFYTSTIQRVISKPIISS